MLEELKAMMSLFEGYMDAYGTYKVGAQAVPGEKNVGVAHTLKKPVGEKLWMDHLLGFAGIGIIPINEKSTVKFGAIDIDKYDIDHKKLITDIERMKMPLVVCRTKSGGAHCYLFLTEQYSARIVQAKLREMAGLLGYGTSEIYPKQVEILIERGDIGQWINMPYFHHRETTRYGYNEKFQPMVLQEFVMYAMRRQTTGAKLKSWKVEIEEALPGGPPCLQILCKQGFPAGTRNNGMYNLGVYAMKSSPDGWEKLLVEYNNRFMDPPLDPSEVMGVIKSLKKKEYNYSCQQAPIQPHCNAQACRMCKFGVGNGMGLPVLGTLTKLLTNPPIWFLDTEDGHRMELTTEALQNPRMFQLICMETLNMMPAVPKKDVWDALVGKLMENISVIEIPVDMTPGGQLMEWIDRYCNGRAQAQTIDEINLGKPWLNGGFHYFKISDLVSYLDRVRFKYDGGLRWVCKVIRDNGGAHKFFNVKGKGMNVWCVPEFKIVDDKLPLPPLEKENPLE